MLQGGLEEGQYDTRRGEGQPEWRGGCGALHPNAPSLLLLLLLLQERCRQLGTNSAPWAQPQAVAAWRSASRRRLYTSRTALMQPSFSGLLVTCGGEGGTRQAVRTGPGRVGRGRARLAALAGAAAGAQQRGHGSTAGLRPRQAAAPTARVGGPTPASESAYNFITTPCHTRVAAAAPPAQRVLADQTKSIRLLITNKHEFATSSSGGAHLRVLAPHHLAAGGHQAQLAHIHLDDGAWVNGAGGGGGGGRRRQ